LAPISSIMATVWRLEEFSPAVARMARLTGTIALVDISRLTLSAAIPALRQAEAGGEAVHLQVAPEALGDPALPVLLESLGIKGLWVELQPLLMDDSPHQALKRLTDLAPTVAVFPILSEVSLILEVLNQHPGLPQIVLKGCEAAGWVSSESIFTLYAVARDRLRHRESGPGLVIWGGMATPEAAAAFLATGAQGLVLESLPWLTDLAGLGESPRQGLSRLRPDHTQLLGLDLEAPYRVFNKGNSQAAKRLQEAGAAGAAAVTRESRQAFAREVARVAQVPQESHFNREELIPLGVEAAFAQDWAAHYGSGTQQALEGFLAATAARLDRAPEKADLLAHSPLAREMGTRYPIIQGAMSWITDVPQFARAVAEAGGLPTIALGLMDEDALTRKLKRLPEVMGDRPYAVNVIALAENPHRDCQLAWLTEHRPRFTVIAAGEPAFAEVLRDKGLEVMYIAPNEDLLRLACGAGVRYLILEGNEAGGHVGQHTTLTLAQIALTLKRREPHLLEGRRLILAGGIYNRETAFMAAMLGADALQMGTAYLATREIVETGALAPLYQRLILEAAPGGTVVSGEGSGLRVRSLKTPAMDRLAALERDFRGGRQDETSFRREIETLAAGSLLIAAQGTARPGGPPLPEATCLDQGQFMSGACAGAITQVKSVAELHQEVAAGPLALTRPEVGAAPRPGVTAPGPRPPAPASRKDGRERIAVTGMSMVNALGNSPAEVWAAVLGMKSGITLVPPERWNHQLYYHPRPRMAEKTYCRMGAFQHLAISRKDLGISPQDFRTMTHATRLTLWLAAQAIDESGILDSDLPPERIAVLISQNSGEAAGTLADLIVRGAWDSILDSIQRVVSLTPELAEAITREVKSGRLAIDDTTLLGRLNCTAGGFISNKYGFMGPSFAVSAACATSLVALYSAIQLIRNGIIDAAIVGGGEENLTPMHFLEFSALGALAGISGEERLPGESSRPFDLTRDGMVLGEGGGMIVIESESAARRRGARVHAYLTGTGASNNHLGLVESSRETQEIAIRAAFQDVPYGPEAVDLVECHATATFQGDVEEVKALQTFYRGNGRTVLTSFKSQIGHTLGASGLNSLIRGVMAMQSGVFPPTLNYRNPDPEMGLEASSLLVPTEPLDWQVANGRLRRLQVNSFGFGGSNYVMHLEESLDGEDTVLVSLPPETSPGEASGPAGDLPPGVFCGRTTLDGHSYRVTVVADSEAEALNRIQALEPLPPQGPLPEKTLRVLGRKGIFLGLESAAPPPLALVFPGQGAQYAGMGHELYQKFPVIRHWMDRAAACADFDLLELLFQDREEDLQKTRWQQPATFTLEFSLVQHLLSLGIKPLAMAGHSLGELTALATSGVFSFEDGFRLVNKRALCMDKACELNLDPGIMIATDAPLEVVEAKLKGRLDAYITNYNAPRQVVVGGDTAAVQALREEIKAEGYRATQLRVSMAFHSPLMRVIHDELEEFIGPIPFQAPSIPVVSNTTRQPFPADPAEIKRIVMAHLESPVHWISNVRTLRQDYGIRVFLEVGPGDTLSNLITETLDSPRCLVTCLAEAESLTLNTATAQLVAEGYLKTPQPLKFISLPTEPGGRPPVMPPASGVTARGLAPAGTADPVEQIVQRQINAFVLDSFGRFLKPGLLAAIRREHDPNFSEDRLEQWLQSRQPAWGSAPAPSADFLVAAPSAMAPAASPSPALPEATDILEEVIRLIMEATGYERDEIEPDMDLRSDLAIRSSRLPVIMDAAETRFGIEIRLEDFMDVRTVRELASRISEVTARGGETGAPREAVKPAAAADQTAAASEVVEGPTLKRLTFHPAPLADFDPQPLELTAADTVAILYPAGNSGWRERVADDLSREFGVKTRTITFLESSPGPEGLGFDLRQPEEARRAAAWLSEDDSLAGVVFLLDDSLEAELRDQSELPRLLQGCFSLMQALAAAPRRKFALTLDGATAETGAGGLLSQGLLGLFLSAALEQPEVLCRTVRLEPETDLAEVWRRALDPRQPVIETRYVEGRLQTREGRVAWLAGSDAPALNLSQEDVVVFSGGGYGITTHLVQSLAPFNPRVVILGRTAIELDPETAKLLLVEEPAEKALRWQIMQQQPEISQEELGREIAKLWRARQVLQTLEDLKASGMEVAYLSCEVTDPGQVQAAVQEIIGKYGRIDGIVHGAGLVRDRLLADLSPEEIAQVLDVKFLGAWNLFSAAKPAGLRFLVALASAAAIQGNRGQSNYTAANRMMSALLSQIRQSHPDILCKALMLPPISGVGMAENAEVRRFLEKMGVGYLEPVELEGLFARELFLGPPDDVWVMFMSRLPEIKNARLDTGIPSPASPGLQAATLTFAPEQFPMIDAVSQMSLREGVVRATRTFSQAKDLWIADHKPFKFLKRPLVSTIMALETFMESSRLLYPHLRVTGVRAAKFLEVIEVPEGVAITSEITCRRLPPTGGEVGCELTMETPILSPTGRVLERKSLNYQAQVILGGEGSPSWLDLPEFPVNLEELDTPPTEFEEISGWYDKHTDMQGRYRVVTYLDGSGLGVVRGTAIYRATQDFSHLQAPALQYSPYVLEGLMQMTSFYLKMRIEADERTVIPVSIGELVLGRQCRDQERLILEARLRAEDSKGLTWDAQALDANGRILMQVQNLRMQWFT
jgi:malonyl CoA-acyl carrier protein transacylase